VTAGICAEHGQRADLARHRELFHSEQATATPPSPSNTYSPVAPCECWDCEHGRTDPYEYLCTDWQDD
jgi:hypothetical protein